MVADSFVDLPPTITSQGVALRIRSLTDNAGRRYLLESGPVRGHAKMVAVQIPEKANVSLRVPENRELAVVDLVRH